MTTHASRAAERPLAELFAAAEVSTSVIVSVGDMMLVSSALGLLTSPPPVVQQVQGQQMVQM